MPTTFSPKEQELFNDLMKGKVSDADIKNLIQEGFLSEKLVEKFLNKLDEKPTGTEKDKKDKKDYFTDKPVQKPMEPATPAHTSEEPEGFADFGKAGYAAF
jgi:hypothetical protein